MGPQEQDEFVELEFAFTDEAYPAVRASARLDCRLDLLDAVRMDDEHTVAFFHVTQADPRSVIEAATRSAYGDDAMIVERFDDECILKLVLRRSVFETLSPHQIPLQSLVVSDGVARFVVTVPPGHSPQAITSALTDRHQGLRFVGKQACAIAAPFLTQSAFQAVVNERLTGRQLDALHFAFESGYFERPRNTTQAALAAKMDISPSTFGQHLHAALRKLLAALFTDGLTHELPPEQDG